MAVSLQFAALLCSLLFCSSAVLAQYTVCPQVCNCIWRSNKQLTMCENQGLISIPNLLSSATQVLDLNDNNFQMLPSRAFQERGLVNLQKLFLARCKLGTIADDAFYQLTNLVELDLSENLLTHVPMKALVNSTNLRRLLLNNNHIATINAESFATLNNLKFLNLSACQTHTIEPQAFFGLHDLEYLYLQSNQLTSLHYSVVVDLPALYNFELYRNRWHCNCEMRATREWTIRNNIGISIPPACESPARLNGLMWNSLDLDDFACEPEIITTTNEINKSIGQNATLSCVVKGIPEPRVFWHTDDGTYRNLSAPNVRQDKFHIREERDDGIVTSTLVVAQLELGDDATNYICSAENRAGSRVKNFTVFITPMSIGNWSRTELGIGFALFSLLLIFVFLVISFLLLGGSGKQISLFKMLKGNTQNADQDDDDKDPAKTSHLAFFKNATMLSTYQNNGMTATMPQSLSMLGFCNIDKKPEIFPQPETNSLNQQQQQPDLVPAGTMHGGTVNPAMINSITTNDSYPLNGFIGNNGYFYSGENEEHNFEHNLTEQSQAMFMYQQQQQQHHQEQQPQYTMDNDGLYKAVMIPSINNPNYYQQQYNGMTDDDEQGQQQQQQQQQLATLSAGNLYAQHPSHPSNYDLTLPANQMNSIDNLVLTANGGAAWRATPYDMLMIPAEADAYHGGAHRPVQLPNGKTLQYQQENVTNAIYQGLEASPAPQMMPPPVPTQPIIHSQTSLDYYGHSSKVVHQGGSVPINRPVMVGTVEGQVLPSFRYSPDEGYAEETSPATILQGTEV